MPKLSIITRLKRICDSNDFAWTLPLGFNCDERDHDVRRLRRAARAIIRRDLVAQRGWLYVIISSALWPIISGLKAFSGWRKMRGPHHWLWFDMWWLQLAHNIRLEDQYYFRLDQPHNRKRVLRFITDGENKNFLIHLNRNARPERLRDKIPFEQFCALNALPTIPVLVSCKGGVAEATHHASLPHDDIFLKPATLWGGQGAVILSYVPSEQGWRDEHGAQITPTTLVAYAKVRFADLAWIVQPRLRNAPTWASFSPGALCTVRVVTGRLQPASPIEIIYACMRFPRRGAMVDNLSSGGLGSEYDTTTGRLGPARSLKHDTQVYDVHPDTHAPLNGVIIPRWDKLSALALRAHAAIPDIATIGWDITLVNEDPIFIEANTNWGVLLDTPLGDTRYVEIMLHPEQWSRL
jgi:hypothetical protein